MDHLIIVDCQYDFIDGSLACSHSREAVRNIIAFANANDVGMHVHIGLAQQNK